MILENDLTERFKGIIENELYDTGALYRSIEIYSYESGNVVYFDVVCEEYIVYHIERLNLLERLSEFDEFQEAYERYVEINLEPALQESVSSINAKDPTAELLIPRCVILVNSV